MMCVVCIYIYISLSLYIDLPDLIETAVGVPHVDRAECRELL